MTKLKRKSFLLAVMCFLGWSVIFGLIEAKADYWLPLPPYNTLWPLWSPVLSPIDALTGEPTPIIGSLSASTVLPVQPALTWDPEWPNPWLLYTTPLGLLFYDPLYGINQWPPQYLIDPTTGTPLPITLPSGYALLAPTDPTWLQSTVPVANNSYQLAYPSYAPPAPSAAIPSALLALFGLTNITIPALPPASSTLLSAVDLLGFIP